MWIASALAVIAVTFAWARALDFPSVRVEVGGYDRAALAGEWPRAVRTDVDDAAAGGDARSFYYRAAPWTSALRLPLTSEGPLRVDVRAATRIRSGITVSRGGASGSETIVPHGRWERFPGPWGRYSMDVDGGAGGEELDLRLAVRPLPLVGRTAEDLARPDLLIDFVEVSSPTGLRLSGRGAAIAAAAPGVAVLLLVLVGARPAAAVLGSAAVAAVVALALRAAVVFFADHNPPDIDIHVRRTLDLAAVISITRRGCATARSSPRRPRTSGRRRPRSASAR